VALRRRDLAGFECPHVYSAILAGTDSGSRCFKDVDEDTRRFQSQSARLMGDMKEAGDAPFRGEVELDSKVSLVAGILNPCSYLIKCECAYDVEVPFSSHGPHMTHGT